MKEPVSRQTAEHYTWGGDCDGWHLLSEPGVSVIQERVPPGRSERPHYHQRSHQFFYVLAGSATLETGGQVVRLRCGEGLAVKPQVSHVLRNEGDADLEFLLISAPPSHGDRISTADGESAPAHQGVRQACVKQMPRLETERLILRPFDHSDAGEVMRLAGARAIADTTLHVPHPYVEGMAGEWISKQQEVFDRDGGVAWAITRKSDGALVGAISLMGLVKGHQAELGYWIGTPYWRNGYCTEAARVVLRHAFGDLALVRVYASHFTRNPASGHVLKKVGMRQEGCRRQHVKKWDKIEDIELYGILKHEWEAAADQAATVAPPGATPHR